MNKTAENMRLKQAEQISFHFQKSCKSGLMVLLGILKVNALPASISGRQTV